MEQQIMEINQLRFESGEAMRGISEPKFKPLHGLQTHSEFIEGNPEYEFSFKDISSKQNPSMINLWRQRAKSTRNQILGNLSIDSLYSDNNRLQQVVRNQRQQIEKLKGISSYYHQNYPQCDMLHNSRRQAEHSGPWRQSSKRVQSRYRPEDLESPITVKPFFNTPSTMNYRSDSPGYSQIHSKRRYKDSGSGLNREQEQIYKLKINNLNEMIDYLKRQRELVENEHTIKQMEYKEVVMSLELRLQQEEENRQREMHHMIEDIRGQYQYQLHQIITKNRQASSGRSKRPLTFCSLSGISIIPYSPNPIFGDLQRQLTRERQQVTELKNRLRKQTLQLNSQAKKIMNRLQQNLNNDSIASTRRGDNQDTPREGESVGEMRERQMEYQKRIRELEMEITNIESQYEQQLLEYKRENEELGRRCGNRDLEIILLEQKLNIQQCYKKFNAESLGQKREEVSADNEELESARAQVRELKERIEEKDSSITMLVEKYEKVEAKLLEVIAFNQRVNDANRLIINSNKEPPLSPF